MKIVTADEMREIDRRAIEVVGIPGVVLMENAGRAVSETIKDLLWHLENPRVC
ncbi:MAG: bifunctional ADP-dependent NAD(P)H-hydrate dehydratase/NAD(P)H-hydrate epimerase, partial [Bacillota bacterium]